MMRPTRLVLTVTLTVLCAGPLSAQAVRTNTQPENSRPSAQALVNEAVAQAQTQQKNVLVYFGASWCVFCHLFDAFVASPDAGKVMRDNFVFVHLIALESDRSLDTPGADSLFKAVTGGKATGIPFYFVLDGTGRKIADSFIMPANGNVGYPVEPQEIVAFMKQLETLAPRMTAAQREQVRAYLKKAAAATRR
jgi:thiol:disulfide interchange protein